MSRVSFTGVQALNVEEYVGAVRKLESLTDPYPPDLVVTGACVGVDTLVGRWFAERFPDTSQLVLVPDDPSRVERWWEDYPDAPIEVREGCGSYMERNDLVVAEGDWLVAFTRGPGEIRRSGTWATVRRARKAEKPVDVVPLGA